MSLVVGRDMTVYGDVTIWREGIEPKLDEEGKWDLPSDYTDTFVMCILYEDFQSLYGLDIEKGQKKYMRMDCEWAVEE